MKCVAIRNVFPYVEEQWLQSDTKKFKILRQFVLCASGLSGTIVHCSSFRN